MVPVAQRFIGSAPARLVALLLLAACGADGLLQPSAGDRLFELVAVDDEPLPFSEIQTTLWGNRTMTLRSAELLLRPDSTATLAQRIRWQGDDVDSIAVETVEGFWGLEEGAVVWCPNLGGRWGPCSGIMTAEGDLIVQRLSGSQRDHVFRLRERLH